MNIYIVPGFEAKITDHWFSWLKKELNAFSTTPITTILNFPTPRSPKFATWSKTLQDQIVCDEDCILIAHSLGCITTLATLSSLPSLSHIKGLILVSGFLEPLSILPSLDSFIKTALSHIDPDYLKTIPFKEVIASLDDSVVPSNLSKQLASVIGANYYTLESGGHFLASDGFTTFPMLVACVRRLLESHTST